MGVVYKARHIHFDDEIYAIKQLWQQYSQNPVYVNAFLEEGKKVRRLDHKNIVKVIDILEENGEYFIVMEYIEGRTLSEIIRKETGPIRRERAISLFRQILEGVAYIHSQPKPLIHRDLKPLNILVTSDDTVKITDFGIAKELDDEAGGHSTTVKGTPIYMSPEQIIDPKSVDIRTDIYSLGMTFYEMLCAKTPFSGATNTSATAVYAAIMNGNVPPPTEHYHGISDALSDFVMKSIHKERTHRFSNANEMLQQLDYLDRGGQTTVQGESGFPSIQIPMPKAEVTTIPPLVVSQQSGLKPLKGNEMVQVEGGTIMMGSNYGASDEKPEHRVTISSFLIGKCQVTQELWERIMGNNPSNFIGANRPVENVSWFDATEFCNELSRKEGLTPCYRKRIPEIEEEFFSWLDETKEKVILCDFTANGYRLPTEAEWENAARGGDKSRGYKYSGSNKLDEVGWYGACNNSGNRTEAGGTSEVGKKQPNELGLYDMSGNVWEWCWDLYDGNYYSASPQIDPRGPNAGSRRVIRCGGWNGFPEVCRVAVRNGSYPEIRSIILGFRVVRTKN